MTSVVCTPEPKKAKEASDAGAIGVLLYGPNVGMVGGIGNQLTEALRGLKHTPSKAVSDFLSIALSVSAADTFVRRSASADGWCREISLKVAVQDPSGWTAVKAPLTQALCFLTGDLWSLSFVLTELDSPTANNEIAVEDCVCMVSGGLDSLIGAIDLVEGQKKPLPASYSYPKEGSIQASLGKALLKSTSRHFQANADPKWQGRNETSMRSRSMLFIAYGVVVASAVRGDQKGELKTEVFMPENGFISLNAPLTPRRIGSLSTRTTHPFFISHIQRVLDAVGIPVTLLNPYSFKTKGEMLAECKNQQLLQSVAALSVSCGKWKRTGTQCGRCVPCIIRRAAFHAAGMKDNTQYRFPNLKIARERDDILAFQIATSRKSKDFERWVSQAGPLPDQTRSLYCNVFERGMAEVRTYLKDALQ